ncbi:YraN family protein [Falsigemmobacter faecalis]|uniref:UPF0102 protein EG244_05655 n=1 Tax=Falsigemmobacter faecalis TaxID=2488730 RepID=A0A3P3DRT1_9RHOB|nr:YraN family protein [Falsigemmobacter faecalis]RRH76654.1 hypothetical protein EG244_05655 [Falsigemmobacter faecalis]
MQGQVRTLYGEAAEFSVARLYEAGGTRIAARRWRGRRGEIDLIAREGDLVVFVEVKAAVTHDAALHRLRPAQIRRIRQTIDEFLAGEPKGLMTEIRFDLALVDRYGRIEVRPNILAA